MGVFLILLIKKSRHKMNSPNHIARNSNVFSCCIIALYFSVTFTLLNKPDALRYPCQLPPPRTHKTCFSGDSLKAKNFIFNYFTQLLRLLPAMQLLVSPICLWILDHFSLPKQCGGLLQTSSRKKICWIWTHPCDMAVLVFSFRVPFS